MHSIGKYSNIRSLVQRPSRRVEGIGREIASSVCDRRNDEVYAVTAYLLRLNGIIGESHEINVQTLPKVAMPNRDNFIVVYPIKPAPR